MERRKRIQYETMMREIGDVDDDDAQPTKVLAPPPPPPTGFINSNAVSRSGMFAGRRIPPSTSESKDEVQSESKSKDPMSPKSRANSANSVVASEGKMSYEDEASEDEERNALEKEFNKSSKNGECFAHEG
jgi:hypothetical protein